MKLLVDVGNTALKLALYKNDEITFIGQQEFNWQDINQVLIASVRSNQQLDNLISNANERGVEVITAKVSAQQNGISCAYQQFHNLGIDRWLVVLAAAHLYAGQSAIIVDAGTATTVDILIDGKTHQGGWIIPGIDLMMESITSRAEKVFASEQVSFENTVGINTPEALSYGCLAASLGLVAQARRLFGDNIRVLCTGGYGKLLSEHLENGEFIEDLVLRGLVAYAK
ncbi:Type III pantothenate kinase [Pseudoalteromonas sp. P1-9]|uniref:type III pantothenate kinase n=1 Tax=Pseudoalteromonas sp. P1-9 TaxID=1710354 RepID=UPI0006D63C04|nr:type III pantothenate kinase [Pseudoalteromonas sp. P1-9]KPV94331.1 Type III pantothenate kinase [Pseudoalteromonas sp. P1-9]